MDSLSISNSMKGCLTLVTVTIAYLSTQTYAQLTNSSLPMNTTDSFSDWIQSSKSDSFLSKFVFSPLLGFIYCTYLNTHLCFDLIAIVTTIYIFFVFQSNRAHINLTRKELNSEVNFWYPRRADTVQKLVSVIIPARNEANTIRTCVRALMDQTYPNYEVLVMNDQSTDNTQAVLDELKQDYLRVPAQDGNKIDNEITVDRNGNLLRGRFKCFSSQSEDLPANWYGKSWALQCASKFAKGEILILIDSDTYAYRNLIAYCVQGLEKRDVDFLSGTPKQYLHTFGLKVIVPSVFIMQSYIIPVAKIRNNPDPNISFAIGQLMAIKRSVFDQVGGLEKISNKICEDLHLARLLKKSGFKTEFVALEDHIQCNMYDSFSDAFFGMARNVFSAIDFCWKKYMYSTLIFGSIIEPFVSLIMFATTLSTISFTQIALNIISIIIFSISWLQSMKLHEQPLATALYYPLMMFTMFAVSSFATWASFFGGGHSWKNRIVS